jgi:hypothetical protein
VFGGHRHRGQAGGRSELAATGRYSADTATAVRPAAGPSLQRSCFERLGKEGVGRAA